jgi:guanylate kinase
MSSNRFDAARRGAGFGIAFVVTGPSGAGKTSVIRRVMNRLPRLAFSVSHTTRPRREREIEAEDYFFVDEGEFERLVRSGAFVEHTVYSGARYGTSRRQLEEEFARGNDVILNVEIEGAASLRAVGLGHHPIVYVFLAPSTLDRLAERLRARGTESEETIADRIAVAAREMGARGSFDYLVVNDELDNAVTELASIITAERSRVVAR